MVEIMRAPADRGTPGWCPPLTWDVFQNPDGKVGGAFLSCANGHECYLHLGTHRIAADGTVTPSCVCPIKGCTWHEMVRLIGWNHTTPKEA